MVLRAPESLDALAVGGSALVHVLPDWRRSDERDRLHRGVVQQGVHSLLVTVHDIDDVGWQARLAPQLRHGIGCGGILLGGLDDDRIAGGDGDRNEPHRHHRREVERRDHADDAERLQQGVGVDIGGHALGMPALEQVWDAAGEFDNLQAASDFAQRIGEHLAMLGGDQGRNPLLVGVQQFPVGKQHPRAPGQGGGPPEPLRDGGLGHNLVEQFLRRQVEPSGDLAGCRVEDGGCALGFAAPVLMADQVGDPARLRCRSLRRTGIHRHP